MTDFAGHFHVHDEYSPIDGTGNRNQLTYEAVRKGQTHLGITNHGRLGGVLEHVHACRHPEKYENPLEPGVKRAANERLIPIIGMEAFYRPDRFMDLTDKERYGKNGHNWANHLCIHAGNRDGLRTLFRLSSKSWVDRKVGGGYHGKACIDLPMLKEDNNGLIISTACLASPLAQLIFDGDSKGARKWVRDMKRITNGKLWFEIMPHDLDKQRFLNIELVNLGAEESVGLIATGDVHMPYKKWVALHEVVRMISYQTTVSKQESKKEEGEDVYTEQIDTAFLSSGKQLKKMFAEHHPDLPESIVDESLANTYDFARQFRFFVIGKTTKAPKVDVDAKSVVQNWCDEGWEHLQKTYPKSHWEKWPKQTYIDRRKMEFDVLEEKGVLDYFYIVGDFARWMSSDKPLPARKKDGTLYFPKGRSKRPIRYSCRGSAGGCLVSRLINIHFVDPIPHKLLFERFLNPDRVGYPDIDIDIESEITVITTDDGRELDGRESVKEYIKIVYGHDHVADIIAYSTFAPRAVIKAVLDTQDIDYKHISEITESIGDTERGLERIANGNPNAKPNPIEPNPLVAKLRDDSPQFWQWMLWLEDQIKNDSRHAAGIVITPKPINHYAPTQTGKDHVTSITAWADRAEFPIMSDYGFLKYDILGVKGLAKQELATHFIREYYGEEFEPNDLPALYDPYAVEQEVLDLFVKGITIGIFQFGGRGITQLLRHIKPDNITDISVANALFRPGPMSIAFEYGDRKNGSVPVTFWHDALEPILGETLGLMCFQEQAMEVVKAIGNFTGGQADAMRKIMSKLYRLPGDKAQEVMMEYKEQWMKGCHENGLREEEGEDIWTSKMLPLGNYLFNRSHSSTYGLQAYQDAHVKLHYPLAFYPALLTVEKKAKKEEQIAFLKSTLREARIFDIDIAAPDVNRSGVGWTIDDGKIRYGLVAVNGIGGASARQVIDHQPYDGYIDFVEKLPSNFGVDNNIALAQAGAFDDLASRAFLLGRVPKFDTPVAKFKIKMSCGHLKTKTVKAGDFDELEEKIEVVLDAIECKHHPDASIAECKRDGDTYEVVRWIKDNPGEEAPNVIEKPTKEELLSMEKAVLNLPVSQTRILLAYQPFVKKFVYTEMELEDKPSKPARYRKAGKTYHGSFCSCDECGAAYVTVGGEVTNVKTIKTQGGDHMAFIDVEFGTNRYSCTLFPDAYRRFHHLLRSETLVLVNGHKDTSRKRTQVIVAEMEDAVELAKAKGWKPQRERAKFRSKKRKKIAKKTGLQIMVFDMRGGRAS